MTKLSAWERFSLWIAPRWTLERMRARSVASAMRNYEAAQPGRRTSGWARNRGDVNAVIALAGHELRTHARDLLRNNSYAKRGRNTIANNVVGWGILPKPLGPSAPTAAALWKAWADSTACDADGRTNFAGLQRLVMSTLVSDGEVLIRRRMRRPGDGFAIPMQLQVIEADYLDTNKTGGMAINGIEFDAIGRRRGYWLFPEHPGSATNAGGISRFIPADEVIHVFDSERPGQERGVSWLASAIVNLKDLDEYDDAELMKQKIAALFAAFVTDTDGTAPAVGEQSETDVQIETLEPGQVSYLPPGKNVTFANPPAVTSDTFTTRQLRKIAAGLGVTYEDLTGDYSQVNFSSARMGRIAHAANVRHWQNTMVVPQLCGPVWSWFVMAAQLAGALPSSVPVPADWTAPPLPMIEPDKEGLAAQRNVRSGLMTPSEMVREQGYDPDTHWKAYAADMKKLDELGITLDSDPRKTTQAGQAQAQPGASSPTPPANNTP